MVIKRVLSNKITWQIARGGLLGAAASGAFQSSLMHGVLMFVAMLSIHSSLMFLEARK